MSWADENGREFAHETQYSMDENGCELLIPVIKATYCIEPGDHLALAEEQIAVNPVGECWGKPEESSYKYEPEVAFIKLSTDVILIGSAYAQNAGSTQVDVGLYVGPLKKTVRVIGDRFWVKTLGMAFVSPAEPFESIPLIYERAFGGWDRSNSDPKKHSFEPRNPVGTGFRGKHGKFEEGLRLPNLEDPRRPIMSYDDSPPPAGFGFTSPNWQPRSNFAGTYDDAWMKERMPLLAKDFDRRFFNAASLGLVAPGYLNGDESVVVENASPEGRISFSLPGVPAPQCRVELKGRKDETLETRLDTVVINTDEKLLFLIWRAHLLLRSGPHDVVSIEVQTENMSSPMVANQ